MQDHDLDERSARAAPRSNAPKGETPGPGDADARSPDTPGSGTPGSGTPGSDAPGSGTPDTAPPPRRENTSGIEESITEELGAIIDDARLYATAELVFQKTRARVFGKSIGVAAGAILLALVLLHIALIAMAVGLVIALEPLVTIWGAIAIVVGMMLVGVGALGLVAVARARLIGEMFANPPEAGNEATQTPADHGPREADI